MKSDRGILVGADARQEWLLSWWWENYRRHNAYPVSFADFGLSEEMRSWCKERGELIDLRAASEFVKGQNEVDPLLAKEWESLYPPTFWKLREAWFKKPLACREFPYNWTLWIDLDCEIIGSLEGIWSYREFGVALAKDPFAKTAEHTIYNSGVILFQKNHPLILEWAKGSPEGNGLFRGDQDLLSHLIAKGGYALSELPPIYNWCVGRENKEGGKPFVFHFSGDLAKSYLKMKLRADSLAKGLPLEAIAKLGRPAKSPF